MPSTRRTVLTGAALAAALTLAACSNTQPAQPGASSAASTGATTGATGATTGTTGTTADSSATPSVAAYQPQHKGGTLKLLANAAAGTIDPQVNYTLQYWQLYQATYDGLTAFRKLGGTPRSRWCPTSRQPCR